MFYDKQLPRIQKLHELGKAIKTFPVTAKEVVFMAKRLGYSPHLIEFLKLFPDEEVFEDRTDFIARCESVCLLIQQEREAPEEILQSPPE